ncbi:hypothetical protein GYMLUDRAFT_58482 [Collybiopsis luxurians FD-317 M1]|uniref:Uncharacterized protein n=1 Tax=Collybiopsis luxurians FD-317 M1 TaxID=944289 RepID=A0A0D0CI48_9AGAR|nr:hypothetical protein GYMLUDRAFT_58482 [Collybiopsis luxurians FD-317 M1]
MESDEALQHTPFYGIFYVNQNYEDAIQPWVALIDNQELQFGQAEHKGAGRADANFARGNQYQNVPAHRSGQGNQTNPNRPSAGRDQQEYRSNYLWEQGNEEDAH